MNLKFGCPNLAGCARVGHPQKQSLGMKILEWYYSGMGIRQQENEKGWATRRIKNNDASWETMVPPEIATVIKDRHYFGYHETEDVADAAHG
jgi:hypothetical protein